VGESALLFKGFAVDPIQILAKELLAGEEFFGWQWSVLAMHRQQFKQFALLRHQRQRCLKRAVKGHRSQPISIAGRKLAV
jgi:hypothetical protein